MIVIFVSVENILLPFTPSLVKNVYEKATKKLTTISLSQMYAAKFLFPKTSYL